MTLEIPESEMYWDEHTPPPPEREAFQNYQADYIIAPTKCSLVYLGTDLSNGTKKVLKFIKRIKGREDRIENEIQTMSVVNHPNILRIEDSFPFRQFHCVVTEYAKYHSLHHVIKTQYMDGIPEHTARILMRQMLDAVDHLHKSGIWHRDLKPDNFLVFNWDLQNPIICLADFGFARMFAHNQLGTDYIGTPEFAAPEMYRHTPYNSSVDIWSLGVTLYLMLAARYPFPLEPKRTKISKILSASFIYNLPVFSRVSPDAVDLIKAMCAVSPENRITAEEALHHPWLFTEGKPTEIEGAISKALDMTKDFDDPTF